MFDGLISFLLALLGLGFLVLIHELGHYLMARRVGMRVEVFGIGFGRPIYSFWHKGVRINICWIPFGGYVKIAGMEKASDEGLPKEDGFFSKSPWARIQVALAGPVCNLLFAAFCFFAIWMSGGREKPFSDVTNRIGWVDQTSELYAKGVRPGDRVIAYDNVPLRASKDHFYAAMTGGASLQVDIEKLDGQKMAVQITPYQHPQAVEKGILTTGVLAPASFLVWDPIDAPVVDDSLARESGILPHDRLIWVDGDPLFSQMQLTDVVNDGCLYLTIMRDGHLQHVRIPRIPVGEIKLTAEVKGEISDWQYASGLQHKKLQELWFLPYNLTSDGVVEGPLSLLDVEGKKRLWPGRDKLLPHDRIVAVAGKKVSTSAEILKNFQEKRVLVIVERGGAPLESYKNAEKSLNDGALSQDLMAIVQSIGSESPITQSGNFILLHPITPKTRAELLHTTETSGLRDEEIQALQSIEDPKLRSAAEDSLRLRHKQLYLGLLGVHDEAVLYNPNPFVVAESVASEIYHTMVALFGGYLSPRWMSGPVGILQVIQHQLSVGYMEALFWLGTISLNLAILNLLPLPVLDGGYILLSLFERITGIRLRVETIEKIVLPFAILLIGFLIYLTYYDVVRLLHNFFSTWKVW